PQPALPAPARRPVALAEQADLPEEHVGPLAGLERAPVQPRELGLVVERIDLAEGATQTDVDSPPRRRRMVRGFRCLGWTCFELGILGKQASERSATQAVGGKVKKGAAIDWCGAHRIQSTNTNSLLLKTARQRTARPCCSTMGRTRAISSSVAWRP